MNTPRELDVTEPVVKGPRSEVGNAPSDLRLPTSDRRLPPSGLRFPRSRRGSVLIIVVALLVLMAVIGTAYVSTARVDRGAAAMGSFNTQIDLLLQGACAMSQMAIWQDVSNHFWNASASPTNYTSPTQQTFLATRTPVLVNNNPAWLYISAAPMSNAVFESPYNGAGTTANPAVLQYGQDRQNMQPTSIPITDPTSLQTVVYPALTDPATGLTYLAASAAGDGIADSGLFRLPCGEINGVTYYAAVRIIDNNSAVNASTAWTNNSSPNWQQDIYGDFYPTNINLQGLVADGQSGAAALNLYRCNGSANPSLQPIDDNENLRNDFAFISPYDALWMQLGRRVGNPGYISQGVKYQALPMTECGTLAYHFCLPNPLSSPSVLEQAFPLSLRSAGMATTPYQASQVLSWYNQNFNYAGETAGMTGSYMPRRALITARDGVSTFTLNKTDMGTYNSATSYAFGDVVQMTAGGIRYGCIVPTTGGIAPSDPTGSQYWAPEPWVNHITKVPINTATYDQLWLAYWDAMTDQAGNVPSGTDTAMFRNPIRASQSESTVATGTGTGGSGGGSSGSGGTAGSGATLSPSGGDDTSAIQAAINNSSQGDTIKFTAGTYNISTTLTFLSNRTYLGAGAAGVSITTPPTLSAAETLKMRAGIAAANAQTLRDGGNDVKSQLVYLGVAASGGSVTTGAGTTGAVTTFHWTGGNDNFIMATDNTDTAITVEGITFDSAGIKLNGTATNVQIVGDTIQNISTNSQDGVFDTGLYAPGGMVSSTIDALTISNMSNVGAEATQIGNCDQGCQITDCVFSNCWNGLHITFDASGGAGTVVSRNVCAQIQRNAIEIQGAPNGLTVSDNYVHDWAPQQGVPADAHMAYSIATGGSGGTNANGQNITITNNVAIGDGDPQMGTPPQPAVYFTAFEIMGVNVMVSNNYTSNMGTAQLMDNGTEPTQWSTENNIWCGLTGGPNAANPTGPPVIDGTAPTTNTGNMSYSSANAVAPIHGPLNQAPSIPSVNGSAPTTQPTTQPGTTTQNSPPGLSAMVFGTARNPYITKVYADNDGTMPAAYVAVELYNPYSTPITLTNWRLATLARTGGSGTGLTMTALPSTAAWTSSPPTIAAHGFLTLVSSNTPPPAYGGTTPTTNASPTTGETPNAQVLLQNDLGNALNNELFLVRPRLANGTLTNDPNGTYQELVNGQPNVPDMVPVDSYDFTGLTYPSNTGSNPPREWYYNRADDPGAKKNWHFVYPGPYTPTTIGSLNPCFTATQVGTPGAELPPPTTSGGGGLSIFGTYAGSANYNDVPLQLDNDQCPGPNPSGSEGNMFPFGSFARAGDMLHATFIGSYRIQDSNTAATVYEMNPVTIDSTYAKAFDPTLDKVIPNENIGRFTPICPTGSAIGSAAAPNDYTPTAGTTQLPNNSIAGNWTVYHFTTDLFDYLTVDAPENWTSNAVPSGNVNTSASPYTPTLPDNACLPNVSPVEYPGPAPAAVTTLRTPAFNPASPIDDTVPLEGLININTAPWPVLATLPMVDNAAANANLAKAIVYFRDVDDGTSGTPGVLHPHGPFKTIWELNEVAVNTPSINGGTPMPAQNDPNFGSLYNLKISFFQTLGPYNTNNYDPTVPIAAPNNPNECGELSPQGGNNNIYNDFESQNLALTRISNLITTRSDMYTVYVLVQGWRNVGTKYPSLVVQRRAAFLADRTPITSTNTQMTITNIPNN